MKKKIYEVEEMIDKVKEKLNDDEEKGKVVDIEYEVLEPDPPLQE